MKNSTKNVIALLKKMGDHARTLQESYESKGDKEMAEYYQGRKHSYSMVVSLLESQDFFDKINKIFDK